jgi:tetratricopeptide (TPR) repeat protein
MGKSPQRNTVTEQFTMRPGNTPTARPRREIDDHRCEGHALNGVGATYRQLGRLDEALDCSQHALTIRRDIGDRYGEAWHGTRLGNASPPLCATSSARPTRHPSG